MSSENVKILNEANFQQIIDKGIVLVDFWAEWCAPCRAQSPIIEALATAIHDKATICKVNVDDNQNISQKYEVMSIPTIILFKDGKVVQKLVGLQEQKVLENAIQSAA